MKTHLPEWHTSSKTHEDGDSTMGRAPTAASTAASTAATGVLTQAYEVVPVAQLQPHPDNPRRGDLAAIGDSINANGFYGAVVAQRSTGRILAGNHRWLAAQAAGLESLPVVWVDVDDERALRILLADNRAADLAVNDDAALLALLEDLSLTPGVLAGTGYDPDTLEDLRAVLDAVPTAPPAATDAHYAETPEGEAARNAGRGLEPSISQAGLRELILVYPAADHAEVITMVDALRATGADTADASVSDVVFAALRLAVAQPQAWREAA